MLGAPVFRAVASLEAEMQWMQRMQREDSEQAAIVMANGQLMLEWARQGNLRALQCAVQAMGEDRVLLFYAVRMFREACSLGRVDILRFMVEHGMELRHACMRDILHRVVEKAADEMHAATAHPVVRFLLASGVDVNWQRSGDLLTALHLACSANLFALSALLILHGADVNAVALDGDMPLLCAQHMPRLGRAPTPQDLQQNASLLALLAAHHARSSWRRSQSSPSTSPSTSQPASAAPSSRCIRRLAASTTAISAVSTTEPIHSATATAIGPP